MIDKNLKSLSKKHQKIYIYTYISLLNVEILLIFGHIYNNITDKNIAYFRGIIETTLTELTRDKLLPVYSAALLHNLDWDYAAACTSLIIFLPCMT